MDKFTQLIITALIFLGSLLTFWYHAAPGISFHDSGEFSLALTCWGLAHPPGAPTWSLLANLFYRLGSFDNAARAANLFAGLWGAVTLALLYLFTHALLKELLPVLSGRWAKFAAATAPLFLLHSPAFLEQSFATEQYTLMTALMLAFLLVLHRAVRHASVEPSHTMWRLPFLLGLLTGIAYGNHPSQLALLFPVAAAGVISLYRRGWPSTSRESGWLAAGLCVGLLVFVLLPIAGSRPTLMDHCRVNSWERFWWAFDRDLYKKRTWSEVPEGYVKELFLTYDFIGELGLITFALLPVGLAVVLKRRHLLSGLTLLLLSVYGAGMFQGFIFQEGLKIVYLRHYGVSDWHIPLYMGGSLLAALAVGWMLHTLLCSSRARYAPVAVLLALAVQLPLVGRSVLRSSLRGWEAPMNYVQDHMDVLPEDAIVIANGDNVSMTLAYHSCREGRQTEPQRVLYAYPYPYPYRILSKWHPSQRVPWIRRLEDQEVQPLYHLPLSEERVTSAPLFTDFSSRNASYVKYLLPRGYLFQFMDEPVSVEDVIRAESEWRAKYPRAHRRPAGRVHRLEKEARGMAHWQRAAYFQSHALWPLAVEEYRYSIAWMPLNGSSWLNLGLCLERIGGRREAPVAAYREAMHLEPWLEHTRIMLSDLLLQDGKVEEAKALLEEELELFPASTQAQGKLRNLKSGKAYSPPS